MDVDQPPTHRHPKSQNRQIIFAEHDVDHSVEVRNRDRCAAHHVCTLAIVGVGVFLEDDVHNDVHVFHIHNTAAIHITTDVLFHNLTVEVDVHGSVAIGHHIAGIRLSLNKDVGVDVCSHIRRAELAVEVDGELLVGDIAQIATILLGDKALVSLDILHGHVLRASHGGVAVGADSAGKVVILQLGQRVGHAVVDDDEVVHGSLVGTIGILGDGHERVVLDGLASSSSHGHATLVVGGTRSKHAQHSGKQ